MKAKGPNGTYLKNKIIALRTLKNTFCETLSIKSSALRSFYLYTKKNEMSMSQKFNTHFKFHQEKLQEFVFG